MQQVCDFASSADLPHSGDSGFYGEAGAVVGFVEDGFGEERGAGAYEGKLAFQYVPELGEFVEKSQVPTKKN